MKLCGRLVLNILVISSVGCTELPDVDASCGNGVIESASEDCDTSDASCRPPGDELECRRDCSILDESTGARRECPAGWGCGADSICRAPSGSFTGSDPVPGVLAFRLTSGDLDGDGATDLVGNQLSGLQTHFFDAAGGLAQTVPLGASPFAPLAVGPLAKQSAALTPDALVLPSNTVSVYLGQDDRTLAVKSYASFPVNAEGLRYVILDAHPPAQGDFQGDEILGFVPIPGQKACFVADAFSNTELFLVPIELGHVQSSVIGANLDEATPCDEMVVAGPDRDHVVLLSTCQLGAGGWTWKTTNNRRDIALPAGTKVALAPSNGTESGVVLPPHVISGDLNQDGHTDLLVHGRNAAGNPGLYVSFGVGNGTMHSSPALPTPANPGDPIPPGNDQFALYSGPGAAVLQMPLAVGVLTYDDKPDFVTPGGLYYSSENGDCLPGYGCETDTFFLANWTKAVIGDFNGNDIPDAVALAGDGRQLAFFNGTGDAFVRSDIQSSGSFRDFTTGDFDGDLLIDIGVQELAFTGEGQLGVLFGKPFGPPEPAVLVAKFPSLEQIGSGRFPIGVSDAIDDLGVVSRSTQNTLGAALFSGSTDRLLSSPLTLLVDNAPPEDDAAAVARNATIGHFDGDAHADVAVLSAAYESNTSTGPVLDEVTRLWLLPAHGSAEIDAATVTHSEPLPKSFLWCGATFAALNLDDDAPEELVLLSTEVDPGGARRGTIAVANVNDASGRPIFEVGPFELVPDLFGDQFSAVECIFEGGNQAIFAGPPLTEGGAPYATPLVVADVDLDGDEDLIAIGALPGPDPAQPYASRLIVFRNDKTGSLGAASQIISELTLQTAGERVNGIGVIQRDTDPELELVLVTTGGEQGETGAIYMTEIDAESAAVGPLERVVERPGLSLSIGDFDGNGVQDFAFGGGEGIQLGLGVAVLP